MLVHDTVLTGKIIGAAIEVHSTLGPGLLESAYHKCLARELEINGISSSSTGHYLWNTGGSSFREAIEWIC